MVVSGSAVEAEEAVEFELFSLSRAFAFAELFRATKRELRRFKGILGF